MVADEEKIYARWLGWGTRLGLGLLSGCFLIYLFQWLEPHVPVQELTRLWALPVDQYLARGGAPTGWGWLLLVHKSDYLNFVGIVILALVTLVCYVRLAVSLLGQGERPQAGLAIAQVLVLLAAASGVFAGSH